MDLSATTVVLLKCVLPFAAGIGLLLYLSGKFLGKFKDSHDILAGLMLHLTEEKQVSLWLWFWIWVALSLFMLVVFPLMLDNDLLQNWFTNLPGLLITLNYTLVVPFLLWAYLELSREAKRFFQPENLDDLGLRFNNRLKECFLFQPVRRKQISNAVLLFVVCIVTAFAVSGLQSPWKCFVKEHGCLYYSVVRALNAYLAGGLILLVFGLLYVFYSGLEHSGIVRFLENNRAPNLETKPSIRRLIKRLSLCLLLGPLVVAIHGWALHWERMFADPWTQSIAVAWIAWLVVMAIGAVCLLYGIGKFNSSVKEAVAKEMRNEVERLWEIQEPSLNSYNTKIEALMNINAYVRSGGKVSGVRESVFLVALSLVLEAIGFISLLFPGIATGVVPNG